MNKTISGIAVFLMTGIVLIILLQRSKNIKSIEPIDRSLSKEKPSERASKSQNRPSFNSSKEQNISTLNHEPTHSTPLQIIEEVGQQFPQYVEIKKILTGYDVCRTNPELAHRLTFETYADLENAHTAASDAFSDILWAEQTAQNRQFGSGSEMANPTNNPSILRAVERISEARQHRAMAIERLERFGIPLSGTDRLSLLTTEPKESIWIMKDLVPKVGGLGD